MAKRWPPRQLAQKIGRRLRVSRRKRYSSAQAQVLATHESMAGKTMSQVVNAGLPVGQIPDDLTELILQPFEREIVQELSPPQQSPVGIG